MTVTTILIACLVISELLPFARYCIKSFNGINSIAQLIYTVIASVYKVLSCHYYRQYKKRKADEKDARIKNIVREEYNKSFSIEKIQKLESTIQRLESFI